MSSVAITAREGVAQTVDKQVSLGIRDAKTIAWARRVEVATKGVCQFWCWVLCACILTACHILLWVE